MAISRSLMNRQLRADGGIMQVAPREKFGLGSKLKKFVRKIIPNEVSEIAVKAAPFVAPFNPLLAAGMAGIGGFDQTGRIGSSLKSGLMTYGMGQGARYLGGAGFQDPSLSVFTPSGFKGGFSSPLGSETGLGKFFSNQGTTAKEGVKAINEGKSNFAQDLTQDLLPGDTVSTVDLVKGDGSTYSNFVDYGKDLLKKGAKAAFYDKDGNLDKAAVIGVATAAASYAEALMLARNAGVELTEEEYDQAQRDEKQAEYGEYLQNFFGGKKDGGRIGYADGPSESDIFGIGGETLMKDKGQTIKKGFKSIGDLILDDEGNMYTPLQYLRKFGEDIFFGGQKNPELPEKFYNKLSDEYVEEMKQVKERGYANGGRIGFESGANGIMGNILKEELMPELDGEDFVIIMTEDGPVKVRKTDIEEMPGMFRDTTTGEGSNMFRRIEEADGGRIGFKSGTIILAEDELAEMGGEQGLKLKLLAEKFMEDGMSESDAYAKAADSLYAKGGRVSRKFGSPKEGESEIGIMSIDVEAGDDEDEEDMMMAGITFSRPEKSYLFRRLGGSGGAERSFTMPQLYRILNNPNRYPDDAAVLKEIAIMGLGEGQKDGGRIGLKDGTDAIRDIDFLLEGQDEFSMQEFGKKVSELNSAERKELADKIYSYELKFKNGGRIGYAKGANRVSELLIKRSDMLAKDPEADVSHIDGEIFQLTGKVFQSVGGISNIPTGNMRKNNAGVVERDYRDEGGFVPVGIKERADDVPAMLSKNEFVMTADAVRGIGNGSVEEGSKKLYNTMKKAEQVGKA